MNKVDNTSNSNDRISQVSSDSDLFIEQSVVTQLKHQLDAKEISPAITTKLRNARIAALQQADVSALSGLKFFSGFTVLPSFKLPLQRYTWMASCASILAVIAVFAFVQFTPNTEDPLAQLDAEADILFADDNLELYEDLEFYNWLANTGY